MDKQKKFNILVVVSFFSFVAWQLAKSGMEENRLNKEGVYVIGEKYKYESGGNRLGSSYYKYNYENVEYSEFHIGDGGINADLVFFKILPSKPNVCRMVKKPKVPDCYTLKHVPSGGWAEIPKDTCR